MMIYLSPIAVAIIGLLMYVLSANGKIVEIGRILFWTGVLAFWLVSGPHIFK